ncbi:MAG: hypothetical protein ABFD62_10025 [Syntrophaceae bacterium]
MSKAEVIKIKPDRRDRKAKLQLESGRKISARTVDKEDLIEIAEPGGRIVMSVRMTAAGAVVTVEGAHLELKSTESIKLNAKKIDICAAEETSIASKGKLNVDSAEELNIRSGEDVKVSGRLIHLN